MAVPCKAGPVGGRTGECQVFRASCLDSEAVSSSSLPAPSGFYRSFLPGGGSTPPGRDTAGGWEDVMQHVDSKSQIHNFFYSLCTFITLLLADSYMSPSTLRA